MAGSKVKTKVVELKYVFITGEGKNQAMPGEPERMQYVASAVMPKDGEAHKALEAMINIEWEAYKKQHSIKGKPKTNGIKDEYIKDPEGEIDPETEEIKKIATGNIIVNFKTNTTWPNGNAQVVKVKDRKGKDITAAIVEADWAIGAKSEGIIHGSVMGNNVGGTQKVTLYLAAVQLTKLVKYEGNDVECEEVEGDDLDLGDSISAVDDSDTADNSPKL